MVNSVHVIPYSIRESITGIDGGDGGGEIPFCDVGGVAGGDADAVCGGEGDAGGEGGGFECLGDVASRIKDADAKEKGNSERKCRESTRTPKICSSPGAESGECVYVPLLCEGIKREAQA